MASNIQTMATASEDYREYLLQVQHHSTAIKRQAEVVRQRLFHHDQIKEQAAAEMADPFRVEQARNAYLEELNKLEALTSQYPTILPV